MGSAYSRRVAIQALRLLPKNALSRVAGRLAALRLPAGLRRPACLAFGRTFGVEFSEVRDPLDSFRSLQDFFTRALRDGVRPVEAASDALVAPCDGTWGAAGIVSNGTVLQLKGRPYRLAALLGDLDAAAAFEGGSFATFYLSPRDYHRFHMPFAARVASARYLPGTLWPVNRLGVEGVDGLFAENERICAYFALDPPGDGTLCAVAVGATMVGKVRVRFDALTTNLAGARPLERRYGAAGVQYAKGEEWGRFEFGSTLVLLLPPERFELEIQAPGTPLRLGTRIGRLISPGAPCQPMD
jgi:phosphatidylserine decarboxylase